MLSDEQKEAGRRARELLHRSWRTLTAPSRALPDFIVLGAQKAGSTSLHQYLRQHPQIFPSRKKEVHYFDLHLDKGTIWYREHFPLRYSLKLRNAITGETSPYYLYHPHAAQRIAQLLPEVKLICLLRNPVDRAISQYWHARTLGFESLPIEKAFDAEDRRLRNEKKRLAKNPEAQSYAHRKWSYMDRGCYADQLRRYFQYFSRDSFLILKSENLFTETQKTYDRVTDFLGVDRYVLKTMQASNSRSYPEPNARLKRRLQSRFEGRNKELFELLGREFEW